MQKSTIILATTNKGKAREFATLLAPFAISVVNLADYPDIPEVEETGKTFEENALLKAVAISKATGLVAIADDSGLEADALDKAPGVYSARYSATPESAATDKKNLEKLLHELKDTPDAQRTGRFCCCIAVSTPKGETITTTGTWEGHITKEPKGDNGFGYDPVFYDAELALTAAQMSAEQKNKRSHRAKAINNMLKLWPSFWDRWLKECS